MQPTKTMMLGLILAVATCVAPSYAATADQKCVAAIAGQVKKAATANLKQTITTGGAATSGFDITKVTRKCPTLPANIAYTGCPAIASECADDADASLSGYAKCVDCLLKALTGRVAQKTAPGKCGNGTVEAPDENCEQVSDCKAGQVCLAPGKAAQCHCFTLPCGNGKRDDGEACDPSVTPAGCSAAEVCSSTCTCGPPVCGDGKIEGSEVCDAAATPSGCGASQRCSPSCAECLADCSPATALTKFAFTTLAGQGCNGTCDNNGPASSRGRPCLSDSLCGAGGTCTGLPNPNLSLGQLRDSTNAPVGSLYPGCLYFGGGLNETTPPAPIPAGATTILSAQGDAAQQIFTLTANPGHGQKDCSQGWDTNGQKYCWNGQAGPSTDGKCSSDEDCCVPQPGGSCARAAGACNPAPKCFFGPPLPVKNPGSLGLQTCLLNVVRGDMSGTLDASTGSPALTIPLASMVFITGQRFGTNTPCPVCTGGVCSAGPNKNLACVPSSVDGSTSLDCPPIVLPPARAPTPSEEADLGAPLPVTLTATQVQASTLDSPAGSPGRMCTQGYCSLSGASTDKAQCSCTNAADNPPNDCESPDCDALTSTCKAQQSAGASGYPSVTSIRTGGTAAQCLRSGDVKQGTIAAVFCIPPTGAAGIDGAAGLPGPGSIILPISMQLLP